MYEPDMHEKHKIVFFTFYLVFIIAMFLLVAHIAEPAVEIDHKEAHHQAVLSEILFLESTHGKNLHGEHGEYGVAQFKYESFEWLKGKANMPWLEWTDHGDQVALLDWCLRNGYRSHWTTAERAEINVLTRKYLPPKAIK